MAKNHSSYASNQNKNSSAHDTGKNSRNCGNKNTHSKNTSKNSTSRSAYDMEDETEKY